MTPELKTACELVFQEHKTSSPIKWNRDSFRGRISIGLSEMAKETLVKKNIIFLPHKNKKIITLLNPEVATASSFEEAEKIIVTKTPELVTRSEYDPDTYINDHVFGFAATPSKYAHHVVSISDEPAAFISATKWYLKPAFCYFIWPVCAAVAGALLSWLLDFTYTELFLDVK